MYVHSYLNENDTIIIDMDEILELFIFLQKLFYLAYFQ